MRATSQAAPCLLMGASFPFVAAAFVRDGRAGAKTGQLLTVNTARGRARRLVMGFVLLPALGRATQLLRRCTAAAAPWLRCAAACIAIGCRAAHRSAPSPWVWCSRWRSGYRAMRSLRAHFRSGGHVHRRARRQHDHRGGCHPPRIRPAVLRGAAHARRVDEQHRTARARRYMSMMAHAAMFSARKHEHALLICYGVGNTASALLSHTALRASRRGRHLARGARLWRRSSHARSAITRCAIRASACSSTTAAII